MRLVMGYAIRIGAFHDWPFCSTSFFSFPLALQNDATDDPPVYNMTGCCRSAGILPQCMKLCTFDLKLSDMSALSSTCQPQMGNYCVYSTTVLLYIHIQFSSRARALAHYERKLCARTVCNSRIICVNPEPGSCA